MMAEDVRKALPVACPGDGSNPSSVSRKPPAASQDMGCPCEIPAGTTSGSSPDCLVPTALLTRNTGKSTLRVTLYRRKGVLSGFEVSGHAHFGSPGQDIVCAGVSAIAQAVEFGLASLPTKGLFRVEKRPGHLSLEVVEPWPTDSIVAGMLAVAEAGFQGIAESYPGWLALTYEEVA